MHKKIPPCKLLQSGISCDNPFYLLPPNFAIIRTIAATMIITINMPKPIPALKISPITSQLVAVNNTNNKSPSIAALRFMILLF